MHNNRYRFLTWTHFSLWAPTFSISKLRIRPTKLLLTFNCHLVKLGPQASDELPLAFIGLVDRGGQHFQFLQTV